jgi:hypothetical protein
VTAASQADPTKSAYATVTLTPPQCGSIGYNYQRTITIDHTRIPNTDQTNFPFLFNTTDPAFATTTNGGHVTSSTGNDIIFSTDPNGLTQLDYELEEYNPVTGQVIAWVRIPTLSHTTDTALYVFYEIPASRRPSRTRPRVGQQLSGRLARCQQWRSTISSGQH